MKPKLTGFGVPQFKKFDDRKGNTEKHVVFFLNSPMILYAEVLKTPD